MHSSPVSSTATTRTSALHEEMRTALLEIFVYAGQYSRHRKRTVGRYAGDLPRSRFIVYSQNHDQVGNRAAGERLCHLVSEGRVHMAAAITLLSPMVPMLFQGEEWAASTPFQYFTELGDAHLRKAVTNGRRREFRAFGWPPDSVPDPQALTTFENGRSSSGTRSTKGSHARMLDWYRRLIELRRVRLLASEAQEAWRPTRGTTARARLLAYYARGPAGVLQPRRTTPCVCPRRWARCCCCHRTMRSVWTSTPTLNRQLGGDLEQRRERWDSS